jgi:hypothetical protein
MTMFPFAMRPVATVPIVAMRANVQSNPRRAEDNVRAGLGQCSRGNDAKGYTCGQKRFHDNDPFAIIPP